MTAATNIFLSRVIPVGSEDAYWVTAADWMASHLEVPIIVSILYLVIVFGGQRIMRDREAVHLYWTTICWNVLQSLFSYCVAYFFWIQGGALNVLIEKGLIQGLTYEACTLQSEYANPWVYFFCLSKIPDMVDTFLLVLKKREIILLHWYHHISVMAFCWAAWATRIENGGVFAGLNAVIHSIMYTYYTVASTGVRFPNSVRSLVTLMQIVQMVIGSLVVVHNIVYCNFNPVVQYAGLAMYLSYLVLFIHFFYVQYINPKPKLQAGSKSKQH